MHGPAVDQQPGAGRDHVHLRRAVRETRQHLRRADQARPRPAAARPVAKAAEAEQHPPGQRAGGGREEGGHPEQDRLDASAGLGGAREGRRGPGRVAGVAEGRGEGGEQLPAEVAPPEGEQGDGQGDTEELGDLEPDPAKGDRDPDPLDPRYPRGGGAEEGERRRGAARPVDEGQQGDAEACHPDVRLDAPRQCGRRQTAHQHTGQRQAYHRASPRAPEHRREGSGQRGGSQDPRTARIPESTGEGRAAESGGSSRVGQRVRRLHEPGRRAPVDQDSRGVADLERQYLRGDRGGVAREGEEGRGGPGERVQTAEAGGGGGLGADGSAVRDRVRDIESELRLDLLDREFVEEGGGGGGGG